MCPERCLGSVSVTVQLTSQFRSQPAAVGVRSLVIDHTGPVKQSISNVACKETRPRERIVGSLFTSFVTHTFLQLRCAEAARGLASNARTPQCNSFTVIPAAAPERSRGISPRAVSTMHRREKRTYGPPGHWYR